MVYRLTQEEFNALGYDLDKEIQTYTKAREAHKKTEGLAAPTTYPLVEDIVRRHGGEYRVAETREYVRVVDGVILDRRKFDRVPTDPEWSPRVSPEQLVGYTWNKEAQVWQKPNVPAVPEKMVQDLAVLQRLTVVQEARMNKIMSFLKTALPDADLSLLEFSESELVGFGLKTAAAEKNGE